MMLQYEQINYFCFVAHKVCKIYLMTFNGATLARREQSSLEIGACFSSDLFYMFKIVFFGRQEIRLYLFKKEMRPGITSGIYDL